MTKRFLFLAVFFTLTACDGDTLSGVETFVTYSLDPQSGPSCPNATNASTYTSGTYTSIDCTWYCATYNGQTKRYVSLDFKKSDSTGQIWVLDNEYVSSGIC